MLKTILHLSDLHFGKHHDPALEYLKQFINDQEKPFDAIAVTGDWTQRARPSQFKQAVKFIQEIKVPIITVPGNHDVPLYNLFFRFFKPYANYDKYIRPHTLMEYFDEALAIYGMSTVNTYAIESGIIKSKEIIKAKKFFENHPQKIRILLCHHPMKEFFQSGKEWPNYPHIILSGHTHFSGSEYLNLNPTIKAILISCGTSISTHLRLDHQNSFNVIHLSEKKVNVHAYHLSDEGFERLSTSDFNLG